MNSKKSFSIILAVIILLMSMVLPVTATDSAGPAPQLLRLNNTDYTLESIIINDGNNAIINVEYKGYKNITTGATITFQMQRKVLFWWTNVEYGEWINTFYTYYGSATHTIRLQQTGQYRVVIQYTITGTAGSPDVIDKTLYCDYN